MAFSDFKTIADVQKRYAIKYMESCFITGGELPPAETYARDLDFSRNHIDIFASEASRSEIIISPLLREVYKHHCSRYSFWIQKSIAYDETLCGTPDYMFSRKSELGITVLEKPIVIVVEARKNDFELGWGQCLAELVASQKLNENPHRTVYGIVTDGNLWQFGKLLADIYTKNPENFTIDKLPRLYGALEYLARLLEQEDT